ncbi:MAG: HK97 family phage prohead protease [Planctomycetaceae bacterium]|nr:HK97 family phage prohead protease [Planctomycetaceae bacterium]
MKTALFTRATRPEVRDDNGTKTITGYGAVFYKEGDAGTEYKLWDDMVERIMPGAFDRAIREDDVRSLFNHDPNLILGRTKSNTLRLSIDAVGLKYEVDPPAARGDVVEALQRGDVDGSSFMFEITEVVWREVDKLYVREILGVKLWEVGPVVFPAYESSTSGLRESYKQAVREERSKGKPIAPLAAELRRRKEMQARARVVELQERQRRSN